MRQIWEKVEGENTGERTELPVISRMNDRTDDSEGYVDQALNPEVVLYISVIIQHFFATMTSST